MTNEIKLCLMFYLLLFVLASCYGHDFEGDDKGLKSKKHNNNFIIFDASLYKNKPGFEQHDIRPLQVIQSFWKKGEDVDKLPEEHYVKTKSKKELLNKDIAFVDVEHWPLRGTSESVSTNKNKYLTIMKWVKEAVPSIDIGLYGIVPIRDYWRALKGVGSKQYKAWQRENDQLSDLANSSNVDIIYPSLYTFYPDRKAWVKYAIANIKEARRYNTNKPVYVFLWPQYHNSSKFLRLKYIPTDYWLLQLETAYKYADGVVIWGGWDFDKWEKASWDENAEWWNVTKDFIKKVSHEK